MGSRNMAKQLKIKLEDMIGMLKKRFSNEREKQETLNKFLAMEEVSNKAAYEELIKTATKISDKNGIELNSFKKLVSPESQM